MAVVNKKIIIHTEQVNRSGYWIKTDGIDLTNYTNNNIVLYEHEFGQRIGLGVNLTKEPNGDLTAEIDFNENSELGKQLKADFESGYIKAASIGVLPLKWSNDRQYMRDGQTKPTMIESEMIEFSLVSIPNNAGAVVFKQSSTGEYIKLGLSDLATDFMSLHESNFNMKKIAVVLGLAENASEEDILKKIADLQAASTATNMGVSTREALEKAIINHGVKLLVIDDTNKPIYERLVKLDLALALEMLSEKIDFTARTNAEPTDGKEDDLRLSALIQKLAGGVRAAPTNEEPKDWDEWQAKNPKGLVEMKAKDWKKFSALYLQKYGTIPPRD